jgi:hypothetical protein
MFERNIKVGHSICFVRISCRKIDVRVMFSAKYDIPGNLKSEVYLPRIKFKEQLTEKHTSK